MSATDNGGRAFPRPAFVGQDQHQEEVRSISQEGMSLRDWFAGMAMQGDLASEGPDFMTDGNEDGSREDRVAKAAYKFADAMLKAREK